MVHPHVQLLQDLYKQILNTGSEYPTVISQLTAMADHLHEQYRARNPKSTWEIRTYHPRMQDKQEQQIFMGKLTPADIQHVIAREYGYMSWAHARKGGKKAFNHDFERAINYLVQGQKEELLRLVDSQPELLKESSPYWHGAPLIYYIAANGVEIWRQMSPVNIVDITRELLSRGADAKAPHNIYNGKGSLAELIESSEHPNKAGVAADLIALVS